uniref:Uncharacterized protein n=1 Tax=Leersia perrieri TaxID=77586 RepID=A0A0D9XGG2_9ORYZ
MKGNWGRKQFGGTDLSPWESSGRQRVGETATILLRIGPVLGAQLNALACDHAAAPGVTGHGRDELQTLGQRLLESSTWGWNSFRWSLRGQV